MKIKFFMAGLLALTSVTAFAQKGELNKATDEYEKYEGLKSAGGALAASSLTNAKTAIDKAAANEKTANLPQTYAVKALVYSNLALNDSVATTSSPLFTAAEDAYKKAKELDTKGENKARIENAGKYLAQYQLNKGVKEYQAGKYDVAYSAFDYYRNILPEDTNAIYYTGLSAANASQKDPKYFPLAINNYTKLLTTPYSKNDDIYFELSTLHLMNKDTAAAFKVLSEGVAKYPAKSNLRSREIELNLVMGKETEAISKIESAIANEPNNKTLYYYAGITYAKTAEALEKDAKKSKVAAKKAELNTKKLDYYNKAAAMYKKALEIDPNYKEVTFNLGSVMLMPAIDLYNEARNLPLSKQKEYTASLTKARAMGDAALPYLQKAVDADPKSGDALLNLKSYYLLKDDMANANKVQKQIDALGK
ncbi:hypothetical protein EOD41_09725 [Mucilaginibacter limnophilus]|uniref:Tetratricopeptide repeat protein n=1 Tax=Mucilaginibacter limnophilus TaxID=1932778 RepID=A0A3S2VMN6_9SPHI|nr:hypothetical protein [Mucilaginibacter limnophilus]RVU00904.1 hypothetical protein EOD41_09725 [Mucilaginibacter limnophilus]